MRVPFVLLLTGRFGCCHWFGLGGWFLFLPDETEAQAVAEIVDDIIAAQKAKPSFDYRPKLEELDALIARVYVLTPAEQDELSTWYRRHYPRLTGDGTEEA